MLTALQSFSSQLWPCWFSEANLHRPHVPSQCKAWTFYPQRMSPCMKLYLGAWNKNISVNSSVPVRRAALRVFSLVEIVLMDAAFRICTYWIEARILTSFKAFCLSFSVSLPIFTYNRRNIRLVFRNVLEKMKWIWSRLQKWFKIMHTFLRAYV